VSKNPDRRELPASSVAEAAEYLRIPVSTLRYWAGGRGTNGYEPIIAAAQASPLLLSFTNLVELHVLGAIRRKYRVSMPRVRSAIDYVAEKLKTRRPLISIEFQTDGVDLFVEHLGSTLNVSREGQVLIESLRDSLTRIERDEKGIPIRLYPYTRNELKNAPKLVVIDPAVSFGRPVLVGTSIATEVIADRYKAGDSMQALAEDYGQSVEEIEEAIRCELPFAV